MPSGSCWSGLAVTCWRGALASGACVISRDGMLGESSSPESSSRRSRTSGSFSMLVGSVGSVGCSGSLTGVGSGLGVVDLVMIWYLEMRSWFRPW